MKIQWFNNLILFIIIIMIVFTGLVSYGSQAIAADDYEYSEIAKERFIFRYPEGAESRLEQIIATANTSRMRLVNEIGVDPEGITVVTLARNRDEFNAMLPYGPLPEWVAGVAYPSENLIFLMQAGHMGQAIDLEKTFLHELSHIILRRAVNNRDLPRWFVEGLAKWQAGEFELERSMRLSKAAFFENLIPLDKLMRRFPANGPAVTLAYDQSYSFINFLVGEFGQARLHELVKRLGAGETFIPALESTYGLNTLQLESRWLKELKIDYNWIPLVTSGSVIWSIAAVFLLMGYIRKRKEKSIRMAEWEEAEARQERHAAMLISAEKQVEGLLNEELGRQMNKANKEEPPMIH